MGGDLDKCLEVKISGWINSANSNWSTASLELLGLCLLWAVFYSYVALRSCIKVHHWNKTTITPNSTVHKKVFQPSWIFTQAPFTEGGFNAAEKPQCMTVSHPSSFLCPSSALSFIPLTLAGPTNTALRLFQVCAAGAEYVGSAIHFTPHWSETCDCSSGLCLFLTPCKSTGVRGHVQEKHTHTKAH